MTHQAIPEGQATGCLPRTTRHGQCCAKLEDKVAATREEIEAAIARPYEQTLLACVESVFSQGRIGSCASEAGVGAIKLVRSFTGMPFVELSPWSVYAFVSGGKDRGSSVGANLRHLLEVGPCTMKSWPRSRGWHAIPPDHLLDTEACLYRAHEWLDINPRNKESDIRTALVNHSPIPFGANAHSEVLLALKDWDTAYKLNSWGPDWSTTQWPGIGTIRLVDVDVERYEAWALRTVTDAGAA